MTIVAVTFWVLIIFSSWCKLLRTLLPGTDNPRNMNTFKCVIFSSSSLHWVIKDMYDTKRREYPAFNCVYSELTTSKRFILIGGHLRRSKSVSTVVMLGVVPALSMCSAVWETPGLIVITKIIPGNDNNVTHSDVTPTTFFTQQSLWDSTVNQRRCFWQLDRWRK